MRTKNARKVKKTNKTPKTVFEGSKDLSSQDSDIKKHREVAGCYFFLKEFADAKVVEKRQRT